MKILEMRIDFNEFYQKKEEEARNQNGDDGFGDEGMYGDESDEDDEEDDDGSQDDGDDGDDYGDDNDSGQRLQHNVYRGKK